MTHQHSTRRSRDAHAWLLLVCGALMLGCGMEDESGSPAPATPGPGANPAPSEGTGRPPVTPPPGMNTPPANTPPATTPPAPTPPIDPGTTTPPPVVTPPATPPTPPVPGDAPYGCSGCIRLFNGTNLDGWDTAPGAWEVKDGVLASTGMNADIYTHEDLGDYRIFFQVRHVKAMGGKDHKPCTCLLYTSPSPRDS